MSFSIKPDVEEIPVTLSLLHLELLTTACRRQNLTLSFNREVTAPYRYELHKTPIESSEVRWMLRSNDIMDVTRFLGLDVRMSEEGFSHAAYRPTVRSAGPTDDAYVSGPVPLKQGVPAPLVVRELPRKDNGNLDPTTPQFRDRCHALRFKSGRPLMECKKALHGAGGDGVKALEVLATPRRYSSTI